MSALLFDAYGRIYFWLIFLFTSEISMEELSPDFREKGI